MLGRTARSAFDPPPATAERPGNADFNPAQIGGFLGTRGNFSASGSPSFTEPPRLPVFVNRRSLGDRVPATDEGQHLSYRGGHAVVHSAGKRGILVCDGLGLVG